MGPSGYGFLHPGIIAANEPALNTLVNQTLAAAALLSTSAYVHWDGAQRALPLPHFLHSSDTRAMLNLRDNGTLCMTSCHGHQRASHSVIQLMHDE